MKLKCTVFHVCLLLLPTLAGAQGDLSLDHLIPKNTVFYIGSHHTPPVEIEYPNYNQGLENLLQSFDDVLEWRVIQAMAQPSEAERNELEHLNFSSLKGSKWAFAVYGLGESSFQLPKLLYVSEVDSPNDAQTVLRYVYDKAKTRIPNVIVNHEDYNGVQVHSLHGPGMIPGLGLVAAVRGSTLWISNSKPQLLSIVENENWPVDSIRENPTYQKVMEILPETHSVTLFANYEPANAGLQQVMDMITSVKAGKPLINKEELPQDMQNEELDETLNEIEEKAKEVMVDPQWAQYIKIAKGVAPFLQMVRANGIGWGVTEEGNEITTAFTYLDTDILGDAAQPIHEMLHREPVDYVFDEYLPINTGTYTAWNWMDLEAIWETAQGIAKETPVGNDFIGMFEDIQKEFGFSLEEDLFSWMGDEVAQVRPVMDLNAVVPINRAALMIKVKDTEKAKASLDKLVQTLVANFTVPITIERQDFRGRTVVSYSSVIPFVPVVPAWCLDGDVLILTTHAALLRELLDVKDGVKPGIGRNRQYRNLSDLLELPANTVSFQDIDKEMSALREGLQRVASISELGQSINQDDEMMPFMIMDRVAYGLSLMQIYKAAGKHTQLNEDGIVSIKQVVKRDLSSVPNTDAMLRYKMSFGAKPFVADLAQTLYNEGESERAIRIYEILAEFYPENTNYLSTLAQWHQEQGDKQAALDVFNQALNIMPDTEMLIVREQLDPDADAETILNRVNEAAEKTKRIQTENALFSIAMQKRDTNKTEVAVQLMDAIVEDQPFSPIAAAAEAEMALMNDEELDTFIDVPVIRNPPIIDAAEEEEAAWSEAPVVPLYFSDGQTENANAFSAQARLARNRTTLFVRMTGKTVDAWQASEENFVLAVSPQRDYKHIKEFINQIQFNEDENSLDQTIVNKTIQEFESLDEGSVQSDSQEGEWSFEFSRNGDQFIAEMGIPLRLITENVESIKTTWTFNLAWISIQNDAFVKLSANGEQQSDNPLLHLFVDMK